MSLPVDERDARKRLARIRDVTSALKATKQALGVDVLIRLGEWAGSLVTTLGTRLASRLAPYNLIVTNVPGPPVPLYMLGAPLLAGFPTVPLFENQGIGVATFSYENQLCFGFNADWDLVPDLHDFVEGIAAAFGELKVAAGVAAPERLKVRTPRSA
jgi:hypothetical protein